MFRKVFKRVRGRGERSQTGESSEDNMAKHVDKSFAKQVLEAHNRLRAKHSAPPLELSDELCDFSQEWANNLAQKDTMQHRQNSQYGENIAMKWSSDESFDITGEVPVEMWYDELKLHSAWGCDPSDLKSGHFTQVVWKGSKKLGVGKARSSSNKILVVCNYDPPGNFRGRYAENVFKN